MSAAADTRGSKRVCVHCGIRFYDFNKRPVKCPSCQTEFSGEIKLKGRRGRIADEPEVAAKPAPANDDAQDSVELRDEGVVSLEDVESLENAETDDDENITLEDDDDIGDLEEPEVVEDEESPGAPADVGKKKKK